MISKIKKLFKPEKFKNKKIIIITHSGADVDAIASAVVLSNILRQLKAEAQIIVPEHISKHAQEFSANFRVKYKVVKKENEINFKEADIIIIVDFNSLHLVGCLEKKLKQEDRKILVIDHHSLETKLKINGIINEDAIATAAIIYEIAKVHNLKLKEKDVQMLIAAIIVDSARFAVANHKTFAIVSELLKKTKTSYAKILSLIETKRDKSEKIAKLKALKRARIFSYGNFVFVTSKIGAFEAQTATSFISLGADVAFVVSDKKPSILSARSSNEFFINTKIDLGKLLAKLSAEVKGRGGGHPSAAALTSNLEPEFILKTALKFLVQELKARDFHEKLKEH